MAKTRYYINYDYDSDKYGPSDGTVFHPYKTSMDAEQAAIENGVDDFTFVEMDDPETRPKWFSLEVCTVWIMITFIGGCVGYFIVVTILEIFRKTFGI